jgi:hypothetical protein
LHVEASDHRYLSSFADKLIIIEGSLSWQNILIVVLDKGLIELYCLCSWVAVDEWIEAIGECKKQAQNDHDYCHDIITLNVGLLIS